MVSSYRIWMMTKWPPIIFILTVLVSFICFLVMLSRFVIFVNGSDVINYNLSVFQFQNGLIVLYASHNQDNSAYNIGVFNTLVASCNKN